MYKFITFIAIFLITGCATTDSSGNTISKLYKEKSANLETYYLVETIIVEKYEDMKSPWRVEFINLNTKEKILYGTAETDAKPGGIRDVRTTVKTWCEETVSPWGIRRETNIDCVLSRYQDEIYYKDFEDVKESYFKTALRTGNPNYMRKLWNQDEIEQIKKARQEKENMQKEIILAGLLSRCENFGWKDDDDLASCVQQEAYRDLQLEKQKHEIKILEQKLASAQNSYIDDDEPLFFVFLDAYAQSKQRESILQMKKDIATLKASSKYKGSSTEAALKSLYRTNN